MEKTLDERITFSPFVLPKVDSLAKFFEDRRYKTILCSYKEIEILQPRESIKGFLGIKKKQRPLVIADLYLDSKDMGADPYKKWVFDVYGKNNVQSIKEIAKELIREYDVDIHIHLKSEVEVEKSSRRVCFQWTI